MQKNKKPETNSEVVTKVCYDCGGVMEGRRGQEYDYRECGLSKVRLVNILVFNCTNPECRAVIPEIPNVAELHLRIALMLIEKPTLLTSEEIRFLRTMANLSGIELSQALGIHPTALSRWENGRRSISKKADASLRLLCFTSMLQERAQNGDGDLMKNVINAAKTLTEIDIKTILQHLQEIMRGSAPIRIDPKSLSGLGAENTAEIGGGMPCTSAIQ
jgi:DNA-binding transcriptional regulator YiaG